MTQKEIAEAYIRSKLPELGFDGMMRCIVCDVSYNSCENEHSAVCGDAHQRKLNDAKQIQLQHWLMAIDTVFGQMKKSGSGTFLNVEVYETPKYEGLSYTTINFNLTTGQPETEADYQAFNEICKV